jgi:hypothetical protein
LGMPGQTVQDAYDTGKGAGSLEKDIKAQRRNSAKA